MTPDERASAVLAELCRIEREQGFAVESGGVVHTVDDGEVLYADGTVELMTAAVAVAIRAAVAAERERVLAALRAVAAEFDAEQSRVIRGTDRNDFTVIPGMKALGIRVACDRVEKEGKDAAASD